MESTTTTSLPRLELPVGPHGTKCRLDTAVPLLVEFVHGAGDPGRHTEANGDPGDPGLPGSFEFKRIRTQRVLVLSGGVGDDVLVVVALGADIYELLDDDQLAQIEASMLRQQRAAREQNRLDAHLAALDDEACA